jgi:phenylacetate-coenzyme A ligase PaaK-like adenylate-forming protein
MHATNFDKNDIERINSMLDFIQNNEYSKFYKEYIDILEISKYEDFLKVPVLKKSKIISYPLKDRIFFDRKEVKLFSSSS